VTPAVLLLVDAFSGRLGAIDAKVLPASTRNGDSRGRICPVDAVDHKILAELQADGRLTITELADRVGLSVSPCHRRLRTLERSGVIAGYRAQLDRQLLGLGFEALVFVTMRGADREILDEFEAAVDGAPNIVHADRLFGEPDYLLRILTTDLAHFQRLYDDQLSTLPGVQKLTSTLVMKGIVANRPPPL
jgi:DNA-binding Lrp family transcriptional regulator